MSSTELEMVPTWGTMRRVTLNLSVNQLARLRELAGAGCGNTSEQIRRSVEAHLEGGPGRRNVDALGPSPPSRRAGSEVTMQRKA